MSLNDTPTEIAFISDFLGGAMRESPALSMR